ncbi:glycosyltransferase [Catenibacterium mitsuokai]|uniref:glycosyltransferase n=1 Tax=Catenibacterium mitsuokai TaxID=100886 RepID=UPI003F9298C1
MNRISIVIPVYQVENYIKRCLDSILSQTYSNLEIILIDDGSRDMSGKICDEYVIKDSRVKVIHQDNAGVSVARNKGLDICTGDYVTFVDSDDFLEPLMYEKMMEKVTEYNCDVVMCDCVKDDGVIQTPYTHDIRAGFYNYNQLKEEYYPHLLMMENVEYPATISNWLILFKREVASNIRYIEGVRYSEDLLFGAQLLYNAKSFYYMKGEFYYHYWTNSDSASHTFKEDKWEDYKVLYEKSRKLFRQDMRILNQSYLMLLFFLYNYAGDILRCKNYSKEEKHRYLKSILSDESIIELFNNIRVYELRIPLKLKIMTYIYKYKIGIKALIDYYEE